MRAYSTLALAAILVVASSANLPAASKNVLLIVADDHGLQLGCYDDHVIRTPHIDSLAAAGTRFSHAFCTTASCSPSRSVILTGLHNHANGQYGLAHHTHHFRTHEFVKSLPVLLKRGGYRTCSIGKTHIEPEVLYQFEKYLNDGTAGGRNTVRMAELAEQFLKEPDERPFFLYYCPLDPHRAAKGFANETKYPGVTPVKYDPEKIPVPPFLPDQPEVRAELAEYYESISRVDQGVGRLLQAVRDTGHWDDTLILYLSDNGMPFPGAKTTLYDSGMHLPLLVRDPAQPRHGVVSDALVSWADITPTILAWTGAKGPDYPLHGRSFLETLAREENPDWDRVYGSHTFHEVTMYYPMRVIRTRKYKCILNLAHDLPYPFAADLYDSATWQGVLRRGDKTYGVRSLDAFVHRPQWELYDLERDPQETVNLAEKPESATVIEQFRKELAAWQKRTADPWLIKYQHE